MIFIGFLMFLLRWSNVCRNHLKVTVEHFNHGFHFSPHWTHWKFSASLVKAHFWRHWCVSLIWFDRGSWQRPPRFISKLAENLQQLSRRTDACVKLCRKLNTNSFKLRSRQNSLGRRRPGWRCIGRIADFRFAEQNHLTLTHSADSAAVIPTG